MIRLASDEDDQFRLQHAGLYFIMKLDETGNTWINYGTLMMFSQPAGDEIPLARGASGEYSDFQYLSDQLDEMADEAGQLMVA